MGPWDIFFGLPLFRFVFNQEPFLFFFGGGMMFMEPLKKTSQRKQWLDATVGLEGHFQQGSSRVMMIRAVPRFSDHPESLKTKLRVASGKGKEEFGLKSRGRVGSRRIGSGRVRNVLKSHGSGRVRLSGTFETQGSSRVRVRRCSKSHGSGRVGSGRVRKFPKSHGSGRVGSGHPDPIRPARK